MITEYTAGFLFSPDNTLVALIRKNRPKWQKGHWNGIGGHVESGESFPMTQRREFLEETGVYIKDWQDFAHLDSDTASIRLFRAWSDKIGTVKTITDEEVGVHPVRDLPVNMVDNLNFLIPLALDTKIEFSRFQYGQFQDRG